MSKPPSSSNTSAAPPPEDAIFTVAVLIDELKHEEAPRRLESMRQLSTIAEALGPDRTRNELLPFLGDSLDDDDEVLLELATQLGNFVPLVGGPGQAASLLASLESLSTVEESAVRDKAVASIIKVTKELSDAFVLERAWPLVKGLATREWFTARISSCAIFSPIYTRVPAATKMEMRLLYASLSKVRSHIVVLLIGCFLLAYFLFLRARARTHTCTTSV